MWNNNALTFLSVMLLSVSSLHLDAAQDPALPQEIKESCDKWGEAYDICPELLEAICFQESRYTPDVVGGTCKGLMQINEPVHRKRINNLGVKDIFDTDSNIHIGADILYDLFTDYSEDAGTVLMLYHGEKNAIKNGNKGNYSEYAQAVLDKAAALEREHGK